MKIIKILRRLFIFNTLLLSFFNVLLVGCKENNNIQEYELYGIMLNKSSLTKRVGDKDQLIATAFPALAHELSYQWISTDETVVHVSNNGMVEAINEGDTRIIVKYMDLHATIPIKVEQDEYTQGCVLYKKKLYNDIPVKELHLNDAGLYTEDGLKITSKDNIVKLERFFALAERVIKYRVRLSPDAKAVFQSSEGDFKVFIDVHNKYISIATDPITEKYVSFLQGNREYIVEIYHIYQQAIVRIIDFETNEQAQISIVNDGQGGCGEGALQKGFNVGMQWDYYCFGLISGSSFLIKEITVCSLKDDVKLLIYGDSITQPEGYFPTNMFPQSWTQMIIDELQGNAMSSGRGGGTITILLDYIRNELPYIKTKYVMITIGTNGGNTENNLTELINYITEQGAIPILNNIPCNESGTQIQENNLIDQIRKSFGINGCMFDIATSIDGDGKEVDKSLMFWEDYSNSYGWQIYHHPNDEGGRRMFERTLLDIPEIYK